MFSLEELTDTEAFKTIVDILNSISYLETLSDEYIQEKYHIPKESMLKHSKDVLNDFYASLGKEVMRLYHESKFVIRENRSLKGSLKKVDESMEH